MSEDCVVKDTSDEIDKSFVTCSSGRLKMGCSMYMTARVLVIASISEKEAVAVNRALLLRFYGDEFDPKTAKEPFGPCGKPPKTAGNRDEVGADEVD